MARPAVLFLTGGKEAVDGLGRDILQQFALDVLTGVLVRLRACPASVGRARRTNPQGLASFYEARAYRVILCSQDPQGCSESVRAETRLTRTPLAKALEETEEDGMAGHFCLAQTPDISILG